MAGIEIPGGDFYPGWQASGTVQKFTKEDLYGHIDGGAELFLEFGFDTLFVQRFVKDGLELTMEIYQMQQPLSALGIYLMKCGKEIPDSAISARNTVNRYQLTFIRDKYFIQINNFSGDSPTQPAMIALANTALAALLKENDLRVINWLPTENREPGSELLIRGSYGLQAIYTFGDEDVLGLAGEHFAQVADYQTEDEGLFTRIKIKYDNTEMAHYSYLNLKNNLDPLLSIIKEDSSFFIFSDYAKEYGSIKWEQEFISIKIHLKRAPDQ